MKDFEKVDNFVKLIDNWISFLPILKSSIIYDLPCCYLVSKLYDIIEEYDFIFDDLNIDDLIPDSKIEL